MRRKPGVIIGASEWLLEPTPTSVVFGGYQISALGPAGSAKGAASAAAVLWARQSITVIIAVQ